MEIINSLPELLTQVGLLIQLVYVNLRHAIGSMPFQLKKYVVVRSFLPQYEFVRINMD